MRVFVLPLSVLLANGLPSSMADTSVKRFQVNLNEPPKKRWEEVTRYWVNYSIAMGIPLKETLVKHLGDNYDAWARVADTAIQGEREQEMIGMLEVGEQITGIKGNLTESKMGQLLYEMASPTLCSGVLWAAEDGTVIHGRNMDYAFHFNMTDESGKTETMNWPNVTFEVQFFRDGKPLYVTTMWPGSVGIGTAMRYDGWAFEQNTRPSNNADENLNAALEGKGIAFGVFARDIMENTSDFEQAVDALYNANYMAPQYFIMSGSGKDEGAVLTIDRRGEHKAATPKIHRVASANLTHWHLVQTNDDLTYPTLDPRRPIANMILKSKTQDEVSVNEMWKFAHNLPLKNPMTVFTTVMVPKTGYYRTILPHQAEPTTASDADSYGAAEAASELTADKLRFSGGAGASVLERGRSVTSRSRAQKGFKERSEGEHGKSEESDENLRKAARARHKFLMRDARSDSNRGDKDDVSALAPVQWPEV